MKTKNIIMLLFLGILNGCYSTGRLPYLINEQKILLSQNNFKVIATAVQGRDEGFWFLGILPNKIPTYSGAMANLHFNLRVKCDIKNKPIALINIVQDTQYFYFLLFAIQEKIITADVIEFIDEEIK